MKRVTIIMLTILTSGQLFGQTGSNGNPVFISVSMGEKVVDDFLLIGIKESH